MKRVFIIRCLLCAMQMGTVSEVAASNVLTTALNKNNSQPVITAPPLKFNLSAEKQKLEKEKAREEFLAEYIAKNGVTKAFPQKFTVHNHYIEAKKNDDKLYDIIYYTCWLN